LQDKVFLDMSDVLKRRMAEGVAGSVIDLIGGTPVLQLDRLVSHMCLNGRVLLKLEYLNPGSSKKDRVALEMIRNARLDGSLTPGQTVVELTSGNTGTGLAIVCGALDHPFIAVMSRGNSVERAQMMKALGATVELVDQAPGGSPGQVSGADLALVETRTRQVADDLGAFRADQFLLLGSVQAHERYTGPELWDQSDGQIDAFVDFVGSAGSFTGVMRALRKSHAGVLGYVVEPATAAVLSGASTSKLGHRIQGGGYSKNELPLLDRSLVDGYMTVDDETVIRTTRLLARLEGVFAGFSTGANVAAALEILKGSDGPISVAALACDSGLKYLSTDLYS
jgi:cysteine synthase A